VVIGRGRLIAQCTTAEFVDAASEDTVRLRSPQAGQLALVLADHGMPSTPDGDDQTLVVTGGTTDRIAELAHRAGYLVLELAPQSASLEEAFLQLTGHEVEYAGGTARPTELVGTTGSPITKPSQVLGNGGERS
jgi:ABC-2 type transport system ATP-binding protein